MTHTQELVLKRKQDRILRNAQAAANGEVPFGYDSIPDWHETTLRFYADVLKDAEFRAQFDAILAESKVEGQEGQPVETEDAVVTYLRNYTGTFDFLNSVKGWVESGKPLSDKQRAAVQRCIDRENAPKAEAPKVEPKPQPQRRNSEPEATEGMYRTEDGTIFKVQRAVHGSGRLYAKRLVVHEDEFDFQKGFKGTKVTFEYESGAIFKLKLSDKMTLEQAKEFGALYGTCCVCGRTLTDERSIEAGIGPICAGKGEWA